MAWAEAGGAAGAAPSECMWAALELTSQRSTEQDMDRRVPRTAPGDLGAAPCGTRLRRPPARKAGLRSSS